MDYIIFTSDQVHLLPGFPEQDVHPLRIRLAIYVQFPPGVAQDSSTTLTKNTLLTVISESREKLEKALNVTIINITAAFFDASTEGSSTVTPPVYREKTMKDYFIIGGAVVGFLFVVVLSVLILRKYVPSQFYNLKGQTASCHVMSNRSRKLDVSGVTVLQYFEHTEEGPSLKRLVYTSYVTLKVAGTSFLARGVDHHRASRVSNTHDRGARFKTGKTKQIWRRAAFFAQGHFCSVGGEIRIIARTTLVNSVYLRKIVSGIQCFPNSKGSSIDRDSHRERIKDSQNITNLPRICVKILQSKHRKLYLTTTATVNDVLAANKTKRLFGARSPARALEAVSGSQNSS